MRDRKPYEDTTLLREIEKVRERQRQGQILAIGDDGYKPWPLPCLKAVPALESRTTWVYTSRYGSFENIRDPYGLYRFTPSNGEYPPGWEQYQLDVPITPATAIIDPAKRWARIVDEDGREIATLADVPVWERGWDLIGKFRKELSRERVPAMVWRVEWQQADGQKPLWYGKAPMVRNEHAAVLVAGYAYDLDRNLIYLSAVGHKTALESIRASLLGRYRRGKLMLRNGTARTSWSGLDGRYEQLWAPLEDFATYHLTLIAQPALKPEATDPVSYFLVFAGDSQDTQSLGRQLLIRRLNEGLPIPVLPEWADAFWRTAKDRGWLSELEVGGDCRAGWQVSLKADWAELVGELLAACSTLAAARGKRLPPWAGFSTARPGARNCRPSGPKRPCR